MKYELKIAAPSLAEVIKAIYAFCVPNSDNMQSGVRIAIDTPEKFLADLIRTGYAKEM